MCGSAFKNKGVQPLLDAVVDYLPSPLDIPPVKGIVPGKDKEVARPADDKAPFAGLAFKIMDDPVRGLDHLRARLFGHGHARHGRAQFGEGQERTRRPHAADACQSAAKTSRKRSPATSSRSRA